jgi:predicted amidohydrolase YtcJ
MELREFVKTTVIELHGAISDIMEKSGVEYVFGSDHGPTAQGGRVKFDVAVEASEKTKGKGDVSVRVPILKTGVGATKESENSSSYTSRIQFELVIRKDGHKIVDNSRMRRTVNETRAALNKLGDAPQSSIKT